MQSAVGITYKPNSMIEAEKERDANGSIQSTFLHGLAADMDRKFQAARQAKIPIENELLKSLRQRKGDYDPEILAQIRDQGGSEIYMLLTSIKCRAAESWIYDIMFPAGDKAWGIDATPIPELNPVTSQRIEADLQQEAMRHFQETGQPVDENTFRDVAESLKKRLLAMLKKQADEIAAKMETKIEDQLVEANWDKALREHIKDLVTYRAGILKGPIVRKRTKMQWKQKNGRWLPEVEDKFIFEFERVSPFDIYPSPNSKNENDGYLFQRHRLSRSDLHALIGVKGYNRKAIREVLDLHGQGGLRNWLLNDTQRARLEDRPNEWLDHDGWIDALEYSGSVMGKDLIDYGMAREKVPDPLAEYECSVWKIGHVIIKAVLNEDPMKRRNYMRSCFEEIPGSFWGYGVTDLCRDAQAMCNAAARSISNNMALASGPMVEVHADRLVDGEDIEALVPWRIFQTMSDRNGTNNPAVRFHNVNAMAPQLIQVYEFFAKLADEHTGIPPYTYGDASVGGAGKTASGLSMLMGAASRGIKQVVSHIDNTISKSIGRMYEINMLYGEDESIKGDLVVKATGTSSLITKEQQQIRRNEFLMATNNPTDMQIIGLEGRAALLREAAKSLDITVDEVVPDKEGVIQKAREAAQQALQQEQASRGGEDPAAQQREAEMMMHKINAENQRMEMDRAKMQAEVERMGREFELKQQEMTYKDREYELKEREMDMREDDYRLKESEIDVKREQNNLRIREAEIRNKGQVDAAKIKADSDMRIAEKTIGSQERVAKAAGDRESAARQAEASKPVEKQEPPQINLPEIHVNIDQKTGKKTINVQRDKDGNISGTVQED